MRPIVALVSFVVLSSACARVPSPRVEPEPEAARARAPAAAPDRPCPCHHRGGAAMAANAPLPGASLYHVDATWTTQDGARATLAALRGHPVLVLMFYGTCRGACPVLVHDLQRIDAALDPATRTATRVAMITFDPEQDTPDRLRELATQDQLDLSRYSLLRGGDGPIREVAAVLGVQYARTPQGFNHSNQIVLLDRDGVPSFTLEGLAQPVDEIVRRTQALAAAL